MYDAQAEIEEWSNRLEALGLSEVALSLFETTRAFGFLISQTILLAQPLLSGIVSETKIEQAAKLLEDPDRLAQVRQQLEKKEG